MDVDAPRGRGDRGYVRSILGEGVRRIRWNDVEIMQNTFVPPGNIAAFFQVNLGGQPHQICRRWNFGRPWGPDCGRALLRVRRAGEHDLRDCYVESDNEDTLPSLWERGLEQPQRLPRRLPTRR